MKTPSELWYRVGIDVGGTFTDFFVWRSDGKVSTAKVLSTPQDPSVGIVEGLSLAAGGEGLDVGAFAGRVRAIVHGTTVATNAVLTRGGARTGLLTTQGVRDALEMRRGIREEQYNNRYTNVVPLVSRRLRFGVRGRLDWQGNEAVPLALRDVENALGRLRAQGVKAVAICFMNAFAEAAHERAAAELVRREMPDAYVSVSSEVLPVIRFYNRVSTTVLNAYVGPILAAYLGKLTAGLARIGFRGAFLVMQSNGGVAGPEVTAKLAASTLLSGPAAGPRAGVAFTALHGKEDCIVIDMGGTSFDASLVQGGAAVLRTEGEIDRLRIALPMLAITTIGAGGGSIGRVASGGLLRMGPASAGALPGPACYGRGGTRPTCTDANVVLGYLSPDFFAGGRLRLDPAAAQKAIEEEVGKPLGLSAQEAAAGMYRVINSNMTHGVREITVKRGLDPREFPMVVAGGAGALHACMIGRELGLPLLVVPPVASTLCAAGMLLSDLAHDFMRSLVSPLAKADRGRLLSFVEEMTAEGTRLLSAEGIVPADASHEISLDLRYLKQYHEVTIPVPRDLLERGDFPAVARDFHARHNRLYGYDLSEEGTGLELINVRVRSVGKVEKPVFPKIARGSADGPLPLKGERRAYIPEEEAFRPIPVYDGHRLLAANRIRGPALIERTDTTIFVSASYDATVDEYGSCLLNRLPQ